VPREELREEGAPRLVAQSGPSSTTLDTRAGNAAASSTATMPPRCVPATAVVAMRSSSSTAITQRAYPSMVAVCPGGTLLSEHP
jgi:hypothetical protein